MIRRSSFATTITRINEHMFLPLSLTKRLMIVHITTQSHEMHLNSFQNLNQWRINYESNTKKTATGNIIWLLKLLSWGRRLKCRLRRKGLGWTKTEIYISILVVAIQYSLRYLRNWWPYKVSKLDLIRLIFTKRQASYVNKSSK